MHKNRLILNSNNNNNKILNRFIINLNIKLRNLIHSQRSFLWLTLSPTKQKINKIVVPVDRRIFILIKKLKEILQNRNLIVKFYHSQNDVSIKYGHILSFIIKIDFQIKIMFFSYNYSCQNYFCWLEVLISVPLDTNFRNLCLLEAFL